MCTRYSSGELVNMSAVVTVAMVKRDNDDLRVIRCLSEQKLLTNRSARRVSNYHFVVHDHFEDHW